MSLWASDSRWQHKYTKAWGTSTAKLLGKFGWSLSTKVIWRIRLLILMELCYWGCRKPRHGGLKIWIQNVWISAGIKYQGWCLQFTTVLSWAHSGLYGTFSLNPQKIDLVNRLGKVSIWAPRIPGRDTSSLVKGDLCRLLPIEATGRTFAMPSNWSTGSKHWCSSEKKTREYKSANLCKWFPPAGIPSIPQTDPGLYWQKLYSVCPNPIGKYGRKMQILP